MNDLENERLLTYIEAHYRDKLNSQFGLNDLEDDGDDGYHGGFQKADLGDIDPDEL